VSGLPGRDAARGRDLAAGLAGAEDAMLLDAALDAGPLALSVRGVSMRPWLRAGDAVLLVRRAPRPGDVALVRVSGRLVLHRLVRRRGGRWLVRGDARPCADGWVGPEAVLAVATGRRRRGEGPWRGMDGTGARALARVRAPLVRTLRRLRAAAVPAPSRTAPAAGITPGEACDASGR